VPVDHDDQQTPIPPPPSSNVLTAPVVAAALPSRAPVAAHEADGRIRIGRSPDNDVVLPDLRASSFHAEIHRSGDTYHVVDLGSTNGVHVNGQRVKQAAIIAGDRVSVGRHDFVFDGTHLNEYVDIGPSSLFADDLSVQIGSQTLLDDVSFAVSEGSLVGVIGPSGCGKSTLLKAITGLRPANQGHVRYDGRSLYDEYAELRFRIGMVPQDDVLHRQLTVRRALRFAASLRFAHDVSRAERAARVDEVLGLLGLAERGNQRIDTLSGGQRKRTSVALELLTEPSMLCLDEPTSGLDPALDRGVMRELRSIADRGRTVVVVTHSVLNLDMCDRVLVMCLGGRMGFFGPPEEVLEFFGASDYADVFEMITDDPAVWSVRYRNSDPYRRHVGDVILQLTAAVSVPAIPAPRPPLESEPVAAPTDPPAPAGPSASVESPQAGAPIAAATPEAASPEAPTPATATFEAASPEAPTPAAPTPERPEPDPPTAPPSPPTAPPVAVAAPRLRGRRRPVAPFRQFVTLSARMAAVIASDRGYTAFLLGLPLVLALLTHSVPGTRGLGPDTTFSLEAQRLLVVLVIGAAFLGVAGAIRDIVSEAPIYARERAVGVSAGAYLASKLVVFFVIDVAQVSLFVWLSLLGRSGPTEPLIFHHAPLLEIIIPVSLVAFVSTVFGLMVSSLVKTVDQTTPVLVVVVMAQLVLCGGLFELHGDHVLEQISWLSPARWGLAAGASTVDLLHKVPFTDPLWTHSVSAWWRSIGWLFVQAAVLTGLTRLALRRKEPGRV
jgi:ABC-type multidrug transport system ATPase subunit